MKKKVFHTLPPTKKLKTASKSKIFNPFIQNDYAIAVKAYSKFLNDGLPASTLQEVSERLGLQAHRSNVYRKRH